MKIKHVDNKLTTVEGCDLRTGDVFYNVNSSSHRPRLKISVNSVYLDGGQHADVIASCHYILLDASLTVSPKRG